jgi:hypothetical protein
MKKLVRNKNSINKIMMRLKYGFSFLLIVLFALNVAAQVQVQEQTTACAQVLRSARAVYEDGRLHELPAILTPCLNSGFSKEERVEALRFLTLTYIYLGEPTKADESMVSLLKTDPFFKINNEVDPVEFINLYRQFRTTPLFSVGVIFGVNYTQNEVSSLHYVLPGAGNGKYSGLININIGLSFEKDFGKKFTLNPEVSLTNRSFNYFNDNIFDDPETPGTTDAKHSQSWIDFNTLMQYKIRQKGESSFYVLLGPGLNYLVGNNAEIETRTATQVISGPAVDLIETNNRLNYSASIGLGARFRLGNIYFRPDIRYQHGLTNVTNPGSRQSNESEAALRYALPINDYRNHTIMLNVVAIMYPYFNPKKKKIKE